MQEQATTYFLHTDYDIKKLSYLAQLYITHRYNDNKDFKEGKEGQIIRKFIQQLGTDKIYNIIQANINKKKLTIKQFENLLANEPTIN